MSEQLNVFDAWTPLNTCARCGAGRTTEGHDACLGYLRGVRFACCGHGVNRPYVRMRTGETLRGPAAIERMRELGGRPPDSVDEPFMFLGSPPEPESLLEELGDEWFELTATAVEWRDGELALRQLGELLRAQRDRVESSVLP